MTPIPPPLSRLLVGLLLLLTLLPSAAAQAREPFSPSPELRVEATALYQDTQDDLTLGALLADAPIFTPVQTRADLQASYTPHPVWLRTRVTHQGEAPGTWILQFLYPMLADVELHLVRDEGVESLRSGLAVPPEARALPHRLTAFPIDLAPGETITLYARVETPSSLVLDFQLLPRDAFHAAGDRETFWLAIYFGILLALGLYNLLLFAGLRERVYLLYALFVTSFGVATLTANGLGPLLLWGQLGDQAIRVVTLGFTLSATLGTLFARQFLDTAHYSPGWHRALGGLLAGCLLGVAGALLLPLQAALQLMDLVGLTTCLMLLACATTCAIRGVPGARLFVLAWTFLLVGASVFALRNLGVLPTNPVTLYGIQLGSALEMLLLSFALAARFNTLKRQKEHAQAQLVASLQAQETLLEEKVAERTAELEAMARHDRLTGLLNRGGLAESAAAALERSRQQQTPLTLFMLDLDGFKPINDRYGHAVGDFVLQQVARRLRHQARAEDHCARFGGDEFILIAEHLGDEEAVRTIEARLAAAIRAPIRLPDGRRVRVGVSIGSSCLLPTEQNLDDLLRRADRAMYAAKTTRCADTSCSDTAR